LPSLIPPCQTAEPFLLIFMLANSSFEESVQG
jgi:hypothetical protein